MLNIQHVTVLLRSELRSALRERNVLVTTIFVPLVLYPVLVWAVITGMTYVSGQTEGFVSRVAFEARGAQGARLLDALDDDDDIRRLDPPPDDPRAALLQGSLDLFVLERDPDDVAALLEGNTRFELLHDASEKRSVRALERVRVHIDQQREAWIVEEARARGLPEELVADPEIERSNVASDKDVGRFVLSLILPLMTVLIVAVGTMAPAVDVTAGERERSTRETTLTLATPRVNVALAKFLTVSLLATLAGFMNLGAMMLSMRFVFLAIAEERGATINVSIPPAAIPLIALGTVLIAFLLASLMMILASFARSYKEGQSLVMPVYFLSFLPMLFLQQPDARQSLGTALIPLVNVFMMFRDAIAGRFDPLLIAVTLLVLGACIALCLAAATRLIRSESLLVGAGDLSPSAIFKRVLEESRESRR